MWSAQHLLLPCSCNTLIFPWGVTHPHFLWSCGLGVFPTCPGSKSREVAQPLPMRRLPQFSDWLWVAQWEPAQDFCWNYWERNTFLPTGTAQVVECKPRAYHHEGRACPRRKVTKRKATKVRQSLLIPSWEHLNQAVPEDGRTFQLRQPITSLSPFSLHDFSFWLLQLVRKYPWVIIRLKTFS